MFGHHRRQAVIEVSEGHHLADLDDTELGDEVIEIAFAHIVERLEDPAGERRWMLDTAVAVTIGVMGLVLLVL